MLIVLQMDDLLLNITNIKFTELKYVQKFIKVNEVDRESLERSYDKYVAFKETVRNSSLSYWTIHSLDFLSRLIQLASLNTVHSS